MKNVKNAFLSAVALTCVVYIYYVITGKSPQENELLSYGVSLFGGILAYLWFIGRRTR